MLFVPDIEPGLALRLLARFADRIAVSTSDSQGYFAKSVIVTGYPVREGLKKWTPESGRAALGLGRDLPVLLVAGGSKGARSINQALVARLPEILEVAQVVHITGTGEWEAVSGATASLSGSLAPRYKPFAYLHEEMGAALAAADLAVTRAGASVLGELPLFGLPAILVPYPHAWRYQRVNAQHLAERQAAVVIEDGALHTELFGLVRALLSDDARRGAMKAAMQSLARPEAAQALAAQLLELGGHAP
jgi:UDP-N-acetylglucosamine--N-acetylmuramyl-(pentapeptide) pyrophosphoryl-undecaprenol N-acetylglucosamine transferase